MSCLSWSPLVLLLICIVLGISQRNWDFELLTVSFESSDEEKVNISMRVDQESFSKAVVTATFDWKYDSDDETMIKLRVYHSRSGRDNDYALSPYQLPEQMLNNFLEAYYTDFIYANLGNCSNLPRVLKAPVPRNVYQLDRCAFTGDGIPYMLPTGYYKLFIEITGEVQVYLNFTAKLTPKSF